MARSFAIEAEALAVVSDLHHAAIEFVVRRRRAVRLADRDRARILIGRMQRVLREQVQDVGHQKFLMLLFVVATEFDQLGDRGPEIILHQRGHRAVDMVAIGDDRLERGARDHAASWARLTGADALVIGIEEEIELRIERAIAGKISARESSARRTMWYAQDAISPGSRRASTARSRRRRTKARRAPRSLRARIDKGS